MQQNRKIGASTLSAQPKVIHVQEQNVDNESDAAIVNTSNGQVNVPAGHAANGNGEAMDPVPERPDYANQESDIVYVRSQPKPASPDVEVVGQSLGSANDTAIDFPPAPIDTTPRKSQPSRPLAINATIGPPPMMGQPQYQPQASTSSSSAAIDLTDDSVAARYAQPQPVMPSPSSRHQLDLTDRRPVCIGSIDTQALILYPISLMQKRGFSRRVGLSE